MNWSGILLFTSHWFGVVDKYGGLDPQVFTYAKKKEKKSHITFFLSLTSFPYDAFRQMNHQVHVGFNMYAVL